MKPLRIVLFCAASLLVSLGVAVWVFPHAALSESSLKHAQTPQAMEALPDVDLGPDFGTVPVTDLMGYYIEHPPQPSGANAAAAVGQHFGGC